MRLHPTRSSVQPITQSQARVPAIQIQNVITLSFLIVRSVTDLIEHISLFNSFQK